ncbi:MAG TPA: ATP synthase subunit I [Cyanothece sp. UBA12306]|nr:ATP synthase subunit I [Cyanothece sp. UBA12306]
MINLLSLSLALLMGISLGLLYFGGLWLTVRQLPVTHNPLRLTLMSFLGRIALCLAGFYVLIVKTGDFALICLFVSLVAFFWLRNSLIKQIKPKIRQF